MNSDNVPVEFKTYVKCLQCGVAHGSLCIKECPDDDAEITKRHKVFVKDVKSELRAKGWHISEDGQCRCPLHAAIAQTPTN